MDDAVESTKRQVNTIDAISQTLTARTKKILIAPPEDAFSHTRSPRLRSLREWLNNSSLYAFAAAAFGFLKDHDYGTALHSLQVAELITHFAPHRQSPASQMAEFYVAGLLHDLGKSRIPEGVINSQEKLTHVEIGMFRAHPEDGAIIIRNVAAELAKFPATNPEGLLAFKEVANAALHHHGTYDGRNSYPEQASKENMTPFHYWLKLMDLIDATLLRNTYRRPLTPAETVEELNKSRGSALPEYLVDIGIDLVLSGQIKEFIKRLHETPDTIPGDKVCCLPIKNTRDDWTPIPPSSAPVQARPVAREAMANAFS